MNDPKAQAAHHPDQPPSPGGAGMTTPQIIRTMEQLEALDPDTILITLGREERAFYILPDDLPAVMIATGEQVRAARQALEKGQA